MGSCGGVEKTEAICTVKASSNKSPSPYFFCCCFCPMGGGCRALCLVEESTRGLVGWIPPCCSTGQQEKLCFPSSWATAAEICESEPPSFQTAGKKNAYTDNRNPPFTRVSADLTRVFPTPMRLSEQGRDLELPQASLWATMIKSIGCGPNLTWKPFSPCSPSTINYAFIR